MSSDRPLGLRELADVDSPEVVGDALRRFRRRLALWGALFAAAVIGLAMLVTGPSIGRGDLQSRLADAGTTPVMTVVSEGNVQITVLTAARLESTYVLHAVVVADGLAPGEGVFVGRPFLVWHPGIDEPDGGLDIPPPPGPPEDLGGPVGSAGSFGPYPVQEVWLEIPLGRRQVVVTIAAGLPERPEPSPPTDATPLTPTGESVLAGSPAEPGTERVLAEITLDMGELGIPQHVWEARQ